MPSPKYYLRQAETLIRYAGVCEDRAVSDRLLSMAHEMMQKADEEHSEADSDLPGLQAHMIPEKADSDGESGRG